MKTIMPLSLFLLLSLLSPYTFAKPISPTGRYICESADPFGRKVSQNTLVVTQVGKEVYQFTWQLNKDTFYDGTGLFNFRNNSLGVTFVDRETPHKVIGIQTYRFNPRGDIMKGPWTLLGAKTRGYQSCQRGRRTGAPARHVSSFVNQ